MQLREFNRTIIEQLEGLYRKILVELLCTL